jgi:hypothetical protein
MFMLGVVMLFILGAGPFQLRQRYSFSEIISRMAGRNITHQARQPWHSKRNVAPRARTNLVSNCRLGQPQ